jgi:hypothetical protein
MRLRIKALLSFVVCGALLGSVLAQGGRANAVPSGAKVNPADPATKPLDARKRFAFDVVRSAVALPQGDPQDRLRVLVAAASVISPIRPALARTYSREGLRIEQDLIQRGEQPAVSMLNTGPVDCKSVQSLVESITAQRVESAEPTLVAAIAACPAVASAAQKLIQRGLDDKNLAPRATLALMEQAGLHSPWSQETFEKLFNTLPAKAAPLQHEAPNLAAMYARVASQVNREVAKGTGLRLLLWLGKLDTSGDRTVAVNVTTGAMKEVLGDKEYDDALASDITARQIAQSAGGEGEISQPMEESVSVLKAMQSANEDRIQQLEALPPSQRAREASASGFASGTGGDRKLAARYFDLAFTSLNQVWSDRATIRNAPAVVQEVSEAAAQVDSMDALRRARGLEDSTAQAIGMISVARVVASREPADTTFASR